MKGNDNLLVKSIEWFVVVATEMIVPPKGSDWLIIVFSNRETNVPMQTVLAME